MSTAKHTPGPLRAVASKSNGDYAVRSADGNIVAEFYEAIRSHDERATEEARANAELFAAAPDMLAELVRCMEREFNPFEPANQSETYWRLRILIDRALGS